MSSNIGVHEARERARHPLLRPMLAISAVLLAVFLAVAYLVATVAAERFLAVYHAPAPADAIVVLGGDGPPRAARAAELWRDGFAPRIIVAGDGDCALIRTAMIHDGVDPAAIGIECRSRNTWENALNAGVLLNDIRPKTSLIVTSWYHSARALRSFETICPGIQWVSVPAEKRDTVSAHDTWAVMIEYAKTLVYYVREASFRPETATNLPCRVPASSGEGA